MSCERGSPRDPRDAIGGCRGTLYGIACTGAAVVAIVLAWYAS